MTGNGNGNGNGQSNSNSNANIDSLISPSHGSAYWNATESTVNGMLGGYPQISRIDMRGSLAFISKLPLPSHSQHQKQNQNQNQNQSQSQNQNSTSKLRFTRAADLGAGIGRITAGVLSRVAAVVDVVEPVEKFAAEARRVLGAAVGSSDGSSSATSTVGEGRLGETYVVGMQDWVPVHGYDLIWIQWCLGHLTSEQTVACLERCKGALSSAGWIVVKENNSTDAAGEDLYDAVDSSVTRTDGSYRALFQRAGLKVERWELQKGFPAELFPVRMYGLRAV